MRDNRSIKTLDVFFLLCDIPEVKDIEKIGYNNNLSDFLHSKLDLLKKRHVYSKRGFANHCDKYCRDPAITLKTINKIIRYIYIYTKILNTKKIMNITFLDVLLSFLMNL